VTSEFIKAQPKNRYGEKILSADVTSSGDINDLQFNNLEVGKHYELRGSILTYDNVSGGTDVKAYSGPNSTGVLYGYLQRNDGQNIQFLGSISPFIFKAESSTLYINTDTNDVRGNGTKEETFLQLEERNDLEKTAKFN
jgi:hypothetical protein